MTHVHDDRSCIKCGYNLRGQAISAMCPECGTAVGDSMRGVLLQFAAPEYRATILKGHSWVLNGILVYILVMVLGVGLGMVSGMGGGQIAGVELVLAGVGMAVNVWIFLGYLKLTEQDPQFTASEKQDSARQIVRIAAIVSIALGALGAMLQLLMIAGTGISIALIAGLAAVVGIGGLIAWAVQFFAMMNYTRWLAGRVPDAWIVKRSRTYRWLLPVLATVGALAVGLGPLIALILYWNLLDRMRKHLKSIQATGAPAALKGAVA